MNAEIIAIGTELLLGEIVDSNSAYISRELRDIGVSIYYHTTVGDNLQRIEAAIRAALERADVVITSGGLGPTVDDMTRQGVANATDRELVFSPELLESIAERFRLYGALMSDNNRSQAYVPAGAIPIINPVGTAPCFIVEAQNGTVISLPGVPREMEYLLEQSVLPYLRERTGGKGIIKALILRTAGIGESTVDAEIRDLETWSNPTVGLAAHSGQTDIRITARADSEAEADALIAQAETIVRERLGEHIYGTGTDPLEETFLALLRDKGLTLAISYTGPQELAVRFQFGDALIAQESSEDLNALARRLGYVVNNPDPATFDFGDLSQKEAQRLLDATGADIAISYVTHDSGTGITAMTRDDARTRRYGFGGAGVGAPLWAGAWAISMAWNLARQMS